MRLAIAVACALVFSGLAEADMTDAYVTLTSPAVLYGIPLFWCVDGDGVGAEPHNHCGCIDLVGSPVEDLSWSSIKVLYRLTTARLPGGLGQS